MYRIDDATAANSIPTPEAAGTEGYFTEGNPATGTPATKVRGSWLNMLQEELCAILAAAGITRSKTTYNQVNGALQKMYSPVVGSVRNGRMYVSAASASATYTADEIVVETALGGQTFRLASFNKTINLATTGAGGMDTGTAPASGFVAIYAIYNPTTQAAALLATNGNSLVGNVYGGANPPSGYTASALVAVVPTNASSQFKACLVQDRSVSLSTTQVLNSSTSSSNTTLSLATAVPVNAKILQGELSLVSTASSAMSLNVAADAGGIGNQNITLTPGTTMVANFSMPLVSQQLIYTSSSSAGTPTYAIYVTGYSI